MDHIRHSEISLLLGDLSVHEDLKKQIAELFLKSVQVRLIQRLQCFISLLKQMFAEGFVSLLSVPGAAFRRTEVGNRILERFK